MFRVGILFSEFVAINYNKVVMKGGKISKSFYESTLKILKVYIRPNFTPP